MEIQFLISELRADGLAINKANLKAKFQQLQSMQVLLDEAIQEVNPLPAQDTIKHDAVEVYLLNLKNANMEQFDIERKLPFEQQAINAGL